MRDLAMLQGDIAAALLGGDMGFVAEELAKPERLSIYRNNSFLSLTEALKATFPVTVKLVDARFFAYAAHAFIAAHPPREARLLVYGAEFPGFLARFAPCRGFPVVAEMARLEWFIAEALNAPECTPALGSGLLAEMGALEGLTLQPSLRFVVSRFPILDVWSSHQAEAPLVTAPLPRKLTRIVLHRRADDIHFLELDAARFAFWRSLGTGSNLECAAHRALSRDPMFDIAAEIVTLFRSGLVAAIASQHAYH